MDENKETCCEHDGFKKIAPVAALVLLVLGVYLVFLARNAWRGYDYIGKSPEFKNQITITGSGKINVKPDVAVMRVGIITEKMTVADAQNENTIRMNKITDALKNNFKVEDKDIQTQQYNITPRYDWSNNIQRIIGYTVSQTVVVKVRDFEKIGDILTMAGSSGANSVNGPDFTVDDPAAFKAQARSKAIAQAKDKAAVLARELGVKLGPIVNFSENGYEPINYYRENFALGMGGDAKTVSPDIEPGSEEINVTVSISYEIR